jgi:hypothetical protein
MQARVSHRVRLDSANDVGIFCKSCGSAAQIYALWRAKPK